MGEEQQVTDSSKQLLKQADAFNKKINNAKEERKRERRGITLFGMKGITILLMVMWSLRTIIFDPIIDTAQVVIERRSLLQPMREVFTTDWYLIQHPLLEKATSAFMFAHMKELTIDLALTILGCAFLPLLCYLLMDGFLRSERRLQDLITLAIVAVVSEIPYDLAYFGRPFEFGQQNVFFGLFVGLVALNALKAIEQKMENNKVLRYVVEILVVLVFAFLAGFSQAEFSFFAVLMLSVMYLLRQNKLISCTLACFLLLSFSKYFLFSLLALIPIALYNGKKGKNMGYVLFISYPVQLLILYFIAGAVGLY